MNELVHIGNSDISIKEYKGKRVVTFKDIDMVHGRPDGTARRNFNINKNHFILGEDYFVRNSFEAKEEFGVAAPNGMYLITEQGYLMLVKSFTDDLAWTVQRQLVNGYFRTNDTMNRSQLSPQMQMFYAIADGQARMELEQKRQAEQLNHVEQRVESIREVVALDTTSWREDTGNILRKISMELGGGQAYSQVRTESYELLSKRMGVNLKQRLTNKRRRMADEGICKSARDKLSYVDIIAEDKKLIEGYTAIVKEMAIRYGVGKDWQENTMKSIVYKHIFKRKNIPEPLYSVKHMLKVCGYGEYANSACDRIADADLLDGEHVQINFMDFPDIFLDYRGVYKCEDILLGYIDMKELDAMEELFLSRHQLVRIQNNMLEFLRNMSLPKIFEMMKESINSDLRDMKEYRKDIIRLGVSEIVARSLINRIIQKCLECFFGILCAIKYRNVLSIMWKIKKKYKSESNGDAGYEKNSKDN